MTKTKKGTEMITLEKFLMWACIALLACAGIAAVLVWLWIHVIKIQPPC